MRLFHNSPKARDFAQIVLYGSYAASTACVMTWPELLDQMSRRTRRKDFASLYEQAEVLER